MLIISGFMQKEIEKAEIPYPKVIGNPSAPHPREMIDMEVRLPCSIRRRYFIVLFTVLRVKVQSRVNGEFCRTAQIIILLSTTPAVPGHHECKPNLPSPNLFISFFFQAQFSQLESEMKDSNANYETLMKTLLELTELKHILKNTQFLFDEVSWLIDLIGC